MPIRGRKEGPGSAGRSKRKASGSRMLTAVELQKLSPSMRLLLLVLDDKNWCQFAWRTGQVVDAKNAGRALPLPVVFRIARKKAGILATDIRTAMDGISILDYTVVAGLGGRPITKKSLHALFDKAVHDDLPALTFLDLDWNIVNKQLERERQKRRSGPVAENILRDVGSSHVAQHS